MDQSEKNDACFSCQKDDGEVPLVKLRFAGKEIWICPQCLPALIHKPDELTEKLSNLI
ncbi:MAG: hypothetical protein KAT07_03580 [Calditrichia bacterium]|nr:hypothetical protein [Calditrichia bacterium]